MKILLVYPSHRNIDTPLVPRPSRVDPGIYPPLGLLYVASSLLRHGGNEVRIIDGQTLDNEDEGVLKAVEDFKPGYVGIAAFTLTLFKAVRFARAIKALDPSIHITFGGPHLRVFPRETISLPCVDSVVLDEGEISYPAMLNVLDGGRLPYNISGVYFKNKGEIVINPRRGLVNDLDSLAFPARHLLSGGMYHLATNRTGPSTTMMSSRGCPYRCIFCCSPHKTYRQRSPENIVDEIEECTEAGIHFFNFMDDVFNLTKKRVVEFSREILRRNLHIGWTFTGRVDGVDGDMLDSAKASGLARITFGIESGSDKVLKNLKKGFTVADVRKAVKACRDLGISVYGFFVFGSPHETRQQIEETINFAVDLDIQAAHFYPLTVSPGTQLYEMAIQETGINGDDIRKYVENPASPLEMKLWETTLSREEIVDLIKTAYWRFYSRPAYLLKTIKNTSSLKECLRLGKAGVSVLRYALGYAQ